MKILIIILLFLLFILGMIFLYCSLITSAKISHHEEFEETLYQIKENAKHHV
ncbi:MAG: hypothetical protein KHY88_03780 [Erysipelotrichaceae bacterium]|nr:hypothetical protein [Erysipelotrichaceae bacterium]